MSCVPGNLPCLLLLALLLCSFRILDARCANACSGHGTCGQNNVCTCFTGWDGGAADCSMRTCPYGTAWADKAYATDKAHLSAECSNAGLCNRATGQCTCFEGFTGSACQRSTCPNDCNNRGNCLSIADVSLFLGMDYSTDQDVSGDGLGAVYNNWDKDSIMMCECDPGFFGADCSLTMCPKGDDPLTINQNYRKISLELRTTSSGFAGAIGITFQAVTSYIDLSNPSDVKCKESLEKSPHIGTIGCTITQTTASIWDITLEFYSFPTYARSNNLYSHDGNPLVTDFTCDESQETTSSRTITCTFEDVVSDNIREYAYCSNRGTCDFTTGYCSCNPGFGGGACSNSTYFAGVGDGANAQPGFQVLVDGIDYQGDALQIRSAKAAAPDFYLIEAIAEDERMFFVRGDGAVGFDSLITPGGVTVGAGGIKVDKGGATITSGGLTISDDGLYVASDDVTTKTHVAKISQTDGGAVSSTFTTLQLSTSSSSAHDHISASDSSGNTVFQVQNTGYTQISATGLSVTGGISVRSTGLTTTDGITIHTGGITLTKGGMTVTEGGLIVHDGIHVKADGIQIDSGGLAVNSAGGDIYAGGLRVHSGVMEGRAGLKSTGGLSIYTSGVTITGGVSIRANGLEVTGGFTVQNSGASITGGLSVKTGGIEVTGGITIHDTGITFAGQTFTTVANTAGTQYELDTSDRRLKTSLSSIDDSLEKLNQLEGVYYHWIDSIQKSDQTGKYDSKRHIGFVAQDVLDVLPEAVDSKREFDNQYLGVDYKALVPVLVNGVKELSRHSEMLEDTLQELKEELRQLQAKVDSMEAAKGNV